MELHVKYSIHGTLNPYNEVSYCVVRYISCRFIDDDIMQRLTVQPSKEEAMEWLRLHLGLMAYEIEHLNLADDVWRNNEAEDLEV